MHQIGDVLVELNQAGGLTVLLVEQKLPFARRVARTFCIMDRGRAVATGAMAELTDDLVSQHRGVTAVPDRDAGVLAGASVSVSRLKSEPSKVPNLPAMVSAGTPPTLDANKRDWSA